MGLYTINLELLDIAIADLVSRSKEVLVIVKDRPGKSLGLILRNIPCVEYSTVGEAERYVFEASTLYHDTIPARVEVTVLGYSKAPYIKGHIKILISHDLEKE